MAHKDPYPALFGTEVLATQEAKEETAKRIANLPPSDDTRSPWFWVRMANGDLILACFPSGDTYMGLEPELII